MSSGLVWNNSLCLVWYISSFGLVYLYILFGISLYLVWFGLSLGLVWYISRLGLVYLYIWFGISLGLVWPCYSLELIIRLPGFNWFLMVKQSV